jgi:hypothetical protein
LVGIRRQRPGLASSWGSAAGSALIGRTAVMTLPPSSGHGDRRPR